PGARSSVPPFRVRRRQLAHSRQAAASVICLRRLPSLHPHISWILQESRKVSYFPLHPLLEMVRGFRFLLRPGSATLHLAVLLPRVKAVDLVACRRPAKEKESPQAAAVFFAARSSPGLGRFFSVAVLSDFQTCLVFRVELKRLLIMIVRVCPVAELLIIDLLCFATLIKCVPKVIMAFALQSGIPRKQCLAK